MGRLSGWGDETSSQEPRIHICQRPEDARRVRGASGIGQHVYVWILSEGSSSIGKRLISRVFFWIVLAMNSHRLWRLIIPF